MENFIRKIPKSDLHVHLDGSVRPSTLIDIAKREKIKLPSFTEEGLNEVLFKDNYANLLEYLRCFDYTIPAMQTPENLERVAYEFAMDNINEGVCYVEVRFAPQFHMSKRMDIETILSSVAKGMDRAKAEYNNRPEVRSGVNPEFHYGIIVCAMRAFGRGLSEYFDMFLDAHKYSDQKMVHALASYELAKATVHTRDKLGLPIVAFDLAGAEAGNPAEDHKLAYHFAHKHFLHLTVHAGEAYGPESIFQAITDLYADRIGHGYYLFDVGKVADPEITDPVEYVRKLAQYIADRRVTIEVCLTSNMQTNPAIGDIKNHQFRKMLDARLSTTLCTDNRTVSKTTVTKEILLAAEHFNLHGKPLKSLLVYGFKRSFFPGTYAEKRKYVRTVLDRYELLEAEMLKLPSQPGDDF
ncbi:MAG: adenosine deaminase [Bdellovibrionales bacterium GWB1_52_6]|nr:MAG: adenosine deaminase [Bdellovibrionales bacterium GWB1_52_6]OFZ03057.1 MAG: adenosine deaminase [Bdellovibrionales bacterium GWA1_52_35]HCM40379.1 adenosine deaminase family protein [Bdellovibrionales bacterium]